jgi:predicted permease
VLAFTLVISIVSGILFGLAPALRVSRLDVHTALKDARGSESGALWGRGRNTRALLVVSELALSVVLLIGAGLLIRSFARIQNVPLGFQPANVLTFELTLTGRKYSNPQTVLSTYRELCDRLEHLPGVSASGGVTALPLSQMYAWTPITVEGRIPPAGEKFLNADLRVATAGYFKTMGIPLRRGRFFEEHDTIETPRVVIVDEYMAEQLWPGQDPIGKRINIVQRADIPWYFVVGVAGRVQHDSLDAAPRIAFYLPHTQSPSRAMNVVLRTSGDPASLGAAAKRELRAIDPDLPVYNLRTMSSRIEDFLARRRFAMLLLSLFAGIALALAAIGVYGVMAYLVSQGRREIGIRVALGASTARILGLIAGRGFLIALLGVSIGLGSALALTRLMRTLLFGVEPVDPLTFSITAVGVLACALLASYIPARRAAQVDPMSSLRAE